MIRNYILVTLRNFLRNANYTFINILGLSVGISACIVIFLLVRYDLRFDQFHSRHESIYRVVTNSQSSSGEEYSSVTPYPLVTAFRQDFPDVPLVTQLHHEERVLVQLEDQKFMVNEIVFTDSLFFKVFDFEVVSGNPAIALGEPGKFFLTESLARKMGVERSDGTVHLKLNNLVEGVVAGIIKDSPVNSHIKFEMIVPMVSLKDDFIGGIPLTSWGVLASSYVYVALPASVSASSLEARLPRFAEKYLDKDANERRKFLLQPMSAIHFDEVYTDNPSLERNASTKELAVMIILGIFILVIACINFVNLSTALAIRKSREIGIRKTLGAGQRQLSVYFLLETFFITVVAVLLSLGILEWIIPFINNFMGKEISINLFGSPDLPLFLAGLILLTTLLSGFYPAIILASYNPTEVLKNKITSRQSSGGQVRKILVVFQFVIAQILIIGTLVIADQMAYFRNKPLGFNKEAVIQIHIPKNDPALLNSLRDRLSANTAITHLSFSLGAPTSDNNMSTGYFLPSDEETVHPVRIKTVDRHYKDTYGLTLKAGRWFTESDEKLADRSIPMQERTYHYIVNESAAARLGFNAPEDIIGKTIRTGIHDIEAEVIGVVKDFHVASLHAEIRPVVLMTFDEFFYQAGIKVQTENLGETIKFIESNWNALFPDYYFEYSFLDEQLEALYRNDERTFTLMKILSAISILVGCLGLYGLISFMANQKLKEVGVRKAMGATPLSIVMLFSQDFIKLILIAAVVAAPLAWYFMNKWLQSFAYHISIHWSVFLLSIFATTVIAVGTISYRSLRAAQTNPAETLRTD